MGSSHNITWSSTGTIANVNIEYSIDSGSNWISIATGTGNDGTYSWTVPNAPSATCLVRVSDIDDDPLDTSNAVFTIAAYVAPSITVTAPAGGSLWERGKTYAITWLQQGAQNANVKILLYKGTATLVKTIIATTPNDGSYDWLVPTTLAAGSTYFIKVKTVDNLLYDDSDKFSIIVPTITVTAPTSGTVWVKNATKTITWNKLGSQDANVKIQLYKGLAKTLDITLSTPNNGSYDWAHSVDPGQRRHLYHAHHDPGRQGGQGKSAAFSITTGLIQVTQPVTGNKLIRGTVQRDHLDSRGCGERQRQDPIVQGARQGARHNSLSTPTAGGTFTWNIPVTQALATTYSIKVTALDNLVSGQDGQLRYRGRDHHRHRSPQPGRSGSAAWRIPSPGATRGTLNANGQGAAGQRDAGGGNAWPPPPANDGSFDWTIPAAQALAATLQDPHHHRGRPGQGRERRVYHRQQCRPHLACPQWRRDT